MILHLNAKFLLQRPSEATAPSGFGRVMRELEPTWDSEDPLETIEWRLLMAKQLMRPGFMTLRAVRHGDLIVDFMWIFASAGAGRMLGHHAIDLHGKRLLEVLAHHRGREALFEQYRCVVELGHASATMQVHQAQGADTIRHGAVRLGDGVTVTLINVSAAQRAHALELALQTRQASTTMTPMRAG